MLIVDDSAMNLLALRCILSSIGVNCDEATDGNEAIEHATNRIHSGLHFYKLILMDFAMPNCDGPTAAAAILKLLKEHRPSEPPVLICCVTAYTTDDFRKTALDSGMKHFFTKPVKSGCIEALLQEVGLR